VEQINSRFKTKTFPANEKYFLLAGNVLFEIQLDCDSNYWGEH